MTIIHLRKTQQTNKQQRKTNRRRNTKTRRRSANDRSSPSMGTIAKSMQLLPWVDVKKIDWRNLSSNPNAIDLLEANPDKIFWHNLSSNPNAIPLFKANPLKIDWASLSKNPNAISLLEALPTKISWYWLSANPNAIPLLEANPLKIDWHSLSQNPNAISLLEANPEKIVWYWLSQNPNAISLLEANPEKIVWKQLSQNPNAISLLEANPEKIDWLWLSQNPNAISLLEANPEKIAWEYLSSNPSIFADSTSFYTTAQKHELYMKHHSTNEINDTLTRGGRLDLSLPLFWDESPIVEEYLTYLLHHRPEIMDEIKRSINNSIKNRLHTNRLNCITAIRFFMENHLFDNDNENKLIQLSVLFVEHAPVIENRNIAIYLFGIMPENKVNAIFDVDTKETYLLHACKNNDVELAECIVSRLQDNTTLHKKDDFGYDAIYYAKQFRMKHVLHRIHELDEKMKHAYIAPSKKFKTPEMNTNERTTIKNGWNPIELQYVDVNTWLLQSPMNLALSFDPNTIVGNYPTICMTSPNIGTALRQPSVYVKECVYIKGALLDYVKTRELPEIYMNISSIGIIGIKNPILIDLNSFTHKLDAIKNVNKLAGKHVHLTKQKTIRGILRQYVLYHPSSHGLLTEGKYTGFATKQSLSLTNYSKHWDIAMNSYLRKGPNYFLSTEFLKYYHRFGKNVDEAKENVLKNIENIDMAFTYAPRTGKSVTVFRGTKNAQTDAPYDGIQQGFISTTSDEDILDMGGNAFISADDQCCIYVYTVEAGIPYITMNQISRYKAENEILLPRGLIVTVDDTEITEDGFKKYLCTIHMPENIQERYPLMEKCVSYDVFDI